MTSSPPTPLPSRDHWESIIGTSFRVAETAAELVLAEVDGPSNHEFAVQFLGPAQPLLGQGMRTLESDSEAPMQVFLVPIGADEDHCRYEAVFNLRPPGS